MGYGLLKTPELSVIEFVKAASNECWELFWLFLCPDNLEAGVGEEEEDDDDIVIDKTGGEKLNSSNSSLVDVKQEMEDELSKNDEML